MDSNALVAMIDGFKHILPNGEWSCLSRVVSPQAIQANTPHHPRCGAQSLAWDTAAFPCTSQRSPCSHPPDYDYYALSEHSCTDYEGIMPCQEPGCGGRHPTEFGKFRAIAPHHTLILPLQDDLDYDTVAQYEAEILAGKVPVAFSIM